MEQLDQRSDRPLDHPIEGSTSSDELGEVVEQRDEVRLLLRDVVLVPATCGQFGHRDAYNEQTDRGFDIRAVTDREALIGLG